MLDTEEKPGVYDKEGKTWVPPGKKTGSKENGSATPDELNQMESNPENGSRTAVGEGENSLSSRNNGHTGGSKLGKGYSGHEPKGKIGAALALLQGKVNKRNVALVASSGLIIGGGFWGAGILSGPFQFVHFAQNLQKHFRSNEDFGDDRTSKVLLYAIAGRGAQNGRLGVTGNAVANKWERKLLDQTGMRPVYSEGSRRFVGFEIVDEKKVESQLGNTNTNRDRKSKKLSSMMGEGAVIRSGSEGTPVLNPDGERLGNNTKFIDLRNVDFGERRAWIRTVGKSTGTNKLASAMNSRLLIKRAGVDFHPLNKAKGRIDDAVAEQLRKKRETEIQNGVKEGPNGTNAGSSGTDEEGNDKPPDQQDIEASDETKSIINEFKNTGVLRSARGPAVLTGVLCAAKGFGNNVEDYKYTNNVLPMIRMGMGAVTTGNQVMSGDDIDIGTMGVMVEYMYDKEKRTTVNQAEAYRAVNGQSGGVKPSPESELGGIDQKPKFFRLLDDIPVLKQVCDVQNFIGGLPIIKQIGQATSLIVDQAVGIFGTSTDEILNSALKAVAGRSVDPKAKGAEFGNLASTGAFLAANDQAISNGGVALSNDERAQLAALEGGYEQGDTEMKSIAERYFDPYNSSSVVSSIIDSAPANEAHAASMIANPIRVIGSGLSGIASRFTPKANAASIYDYGVPKYGYSAREQDDDRFEDPYENARIVEDEANNGQRLEDLNDKYGKCFGMRVTADAGGVHIESDSKAVNVFELEKKDEYKDCRNDKDSEMFKRYRFYLADALIALSLACNDGDDGACEDVGASTGQNPDNSEPGSQTEDTENPTIKKLKPALSGSSCNCDIDPKGITLHWWGNQYGDGIKPLVNIFKDNGLSVQLGITSEGQVYQLTDKLTTKTSHAIGGNATTIGIEIEGGPEQFGKAGIEKYPKKFEAVVATVQYLKNKYNIPVRKNMVCDNASGIFQHKDFNSCPNAVQKSDIDDYYFNEVMKRVK